LTEHSEHDKSHPLTASNGREPLEAEVEIDVDEVKNDMVYRIVVESGIEIVPKARHKSWYSAVMAELGDMD
jgi:hypothetical protein